MFWLWQTVWWLGHGARMHGCMMLSALRGGIYQNNDRPQKHTQAKGRHVIARHVRGGHVQDAQVVRGTKRKNLLYSSKMQCMSIIQARFMVLFFLALHSQISQHYPAGIIALQYTQPTYRRLLFLSLGFLVTFPSPWHPAGRPSYDSSRCARRCSFISKCLSLALSSASAASGCLSFRAATAPSR